MSIPFTILALSLIAPVQQSPFGIKRVERIPVGFTCDQLFQDLLDYPGTSVSGKVGTKNTGLRLALNVTASSDIESEERLTIEVLGYKEFDYIREITLSRKGAAAKVPRMKNISASLGIQEFEVYDVPIVHKERLVNVVCFFPKKGTADEGFVVDLDWHSNRTGPNKDNKDERGNFLYRTMTDYNRLMAGKMLQKVHTRGQKLGLW